MNVVKNMKFKVINKIYYFKPIKHNLTIMTNYKGDKAANIHFASYIDPPIL